MHSLVFPASIPAGPRRLPAAAAIRRGGPRHA